MHNSALRIFRRFHEPKLLGTAAEVRTSIDSLFIRHKVQTAMLDDEKLRDLDIPAQEEVNPLSWLHTVAPAFPVNGSKITIIHKPRVFYSTLLEKCRRAKKRITFASLYLGTGTLETELVGKRDRTSNEHEWRQCASADPAGLYESFPGQAEFPKDAAAVA
ncbi:CDP-diacylglycerol--glycerol-3-phosphate 3-phosphatidyltransferase, mitochondrial [Temnothorax longispinosus]|uniref:CDP-diacylglycerol--glycerol-3-phosphate 3-phosphatidyltransferase n=1 Tax=Temnothorax longispinosus TaxID=300112 RepID=A0A4S2KJS8_9HYME|nr:CDP-diacylglycerol--glycerol-3-phosphate 3-phosphatidyltransferase, mitochondrial [Temnothorax longispinosus]